MGHVLLYIEYTDMGHGYTVYRVYRHGPWSTVYSIQYTDMGHGLLYIQYTDMGHGLLYIVYRHGPWSTVYSIQTWAMVYCI